MSLTLGVPSYRRSTVAKYNRGELASRVAVGNVHMRIGSSLVWAALVICLALATSRAYADGKPSNAKDTAAYSFKGCLESGGDISKTSPRRCTTNKGVAFIEQGESKAPKSFCKDLCGDGECAEIVCLAEGCPCAETNARCPEDCQE